jgi:hypothetical protein
MHTNFKLLLLFVVFTCSSGIALAVEEANKVDIADVITEINKLQTKHLSILQGNDLPSIVGKDDKFFNEKWCDTLKGLTKSLVEHLEVGKNVFDYPGLLGCGRIVTQTEGYMIEMYWRTRHIGDSNSGSIERHIIYFSNKGEITSIGRSMPFAD